MNNKFLVIFIRVFAEFLKLGSQPSYRNLIVFLIFPFLKEEKSIGRDLCYLAEYFADSDDKYFLSVNT